MRQVNRCVEEVDIDKCIYLLGDYDYGFEYFYNKSEVEYNDIICMMIWLRRQMSLF